MIDDYGIPMVYVPAGKFMMGSKLGEGFADERPQHEQVIRLGFWLDVTPVTNESYARFVAAGGYQNQDYWTEPVWTRMQRRQKTGPYDYWSYRDPQLPRGGVTWFEAHAYCNWRCGRLPTEAEWEWAARGPENRVYPWGNIFDSSRVIYNGNSSSEKAPVGESIRQGAASWVGALDMSGNVSEWCSSLYQPYPFDAEDGREDISDGTHDRVVRGRSWDSRGMARGRNVPHIEFNTLGFRCARSA